MFSIITSIRVEIGNVTVEDDLMIHERLIKPQQAAIRVAYNRLLEGWDDKRIWALLREQFKLMTGRNLNDAIMIAKAIMDSQHELLPEYLIKRSCLPFS